MCKQDSALNNLQAWYAAKIQPTNQPTNQQLTNLSLSILVNFFMSKVEIMLYSHVPYHNDTIIKTQEDFFNKIFIPLTLFVRVRKGCVGFYCEWELETEQKLQYFDLHSYGRQRCVFIVLLMLNQRPWGPLCWVLAFFTASYQDLLWSPNSIGVPEGPFGRVWLSLPYLVYLRPISTATALDFCLDWAI